MGSVIEYYLDRLENYGDDVRTLGWGSKTSQWDRFRVLVGVGDLRWRSVLDFGCGFGDLYAYLQENSIRPVLYAGCDCNPAMLAAAKKKYPMATFLDSPAKADYILSSGAFNLDPRWRDAVSMLWDLCGVAMAINFTSSLAEKQNPEILYQDPFEAAAFCSRLAKSFTLRHDYRANDFTVYLYR